ncbi:hypothetical protein [Rhizobium tubonense]|uniref:Lipoprotein n=1 Tax=Rhizobium tubonense TaxID=484088 RepID=A0A2W4CXR0_9HYPH|nr:hypothetical protein [Rhizobium tubonense]PZM15005.1 hypothetical protein CPY51_08095 [Rhizobium tubonense]
MRNALKFCTTFIAIASLSGCVTYVDGVKQTSGKKVAVSGERTLTGRTWLIKPDCTLSRIPNVRVTQPPKHGHVEIVQEELYPSYDSGDFKKCNTVKVMGIRGYYTSNTNYIGPDSYTARTSYGDGTDIEDAVISINVVK